jgi:hypothetical protein
MADAQTGGLNREALKRALDNLHIEDLALRHSVVEVDADCILGVDENQLEIQLKWGARNARLINATDNATNKSRALFIVEIGTSVRLVDKAELKSDDVVKKARAQVDATFLASYRVQDGADIEQPALDEFAKHNVIYHVWPYWREYLANTLARAHLPAFTLPMFRFVGPGEKANALETKVVANK